MFLVLFIHNTGYICMKNIHLDMKTGTPDHEIYELLLNAEKKLFTNLVDRMLICVTGVKHYWL